MKITDKLVQSALSWVGTPFHGHACVKGSGVDCVHLMAAIYIEAGIIERFRPPRYTLDGGRHQENSQIVDYLTNHAQEFAEVTAKQVQTGDLLCLWMGKTIHHAGMAIDSHKFVHCLRDYGVILSPLSDPTWAKRLKKVYRPLILMGLTNAPAQVKRTKTHPCRTCK